MQDLRILNLIHKRLSGELSADELEELKSVENTPEYMDIARDVEAIWIGSKDYFPSHTFDVTAAKAKFKKKLEELESPATTTVSSAEKSPSKSNWLYWVIGAAILGLIGLALYQASSSSRENVLEIEANQPLEYAILEDDTQLWLSEGSLVKVHDFDNTNKRVIELNGEGFFKVTSDPNKPFHVKVPNGNNIEVLGTSFNVISDTGDGTTKVDVREGTVRVFNESSTALSLIVTAGESAKINLDKHEAMKSSSSNIYSLLGPSISFKNESLSNVFNTLSNIYNVSIDYDKAVFDQCSFNSPLIDSFELAQVLDLLQSYYSSLQIKETSAMSVDMAHNPLQVMAELHNIFFKIQPSSVSKQGLDIAE